MDTYKATLSLSEAAAQVITGSPNDDTLLEYYEPKFQSLHRELADHVRGVLRDRTDPMAQTVMMNTLRDGTRSFSVYGKMSDHQIEALNNLSGRFNITHGDTGRMTYNVKIPVPSDEQEAQYKTGELEVPAFERKHSNYDRELHTMLHFYANKGNLKNNLTVGDLRRGLVHDHPEIRAAANVVLQKLINPYQQPDQ